MNILIINLPRYKSTPVIREERCELISKFRVDTPASLLIIAAILRNDGHKIEFIDANALDLNYEDISDMIGDEKFGCVIFPINSAILDHDLNICNMIKEINSSCKTITFSWHSRLFANEILTEYINLDVFITGSTLSIIGDLVKCISEKGNMDDVNGIAYRKEGNLIKLNDNAIQEIKFDDLPMPAYDLLPSFKPYYLADPFMSPYALLYAGKGCIFGCTYCNVSRTKYSSRSIENIIKELLVLKKIGNVKYVWFFDEIFTINREKTIELCRKMVEERIGVKWFCDTRADLVDEELLKVMRASGCIGISYGIESGSQKILNNMDKKITVEQAKNALIWTRKVHIPINLNILLGFIGEDDESIEETKSFVKATLPESLHVGIIIAKPGTNFTKLAIENKWVDENINWKKYLTHGMEFKDYDPFNRSLIDERQKLHRLLYYNPMWWINNVNTLIRNPALILPAIGKLLR